LKPSRVRHSLRSGTHSAFSMKSVKSLLVSEPYPVAEPPPGIVTWALKIAMSEVMVTCSVAIWASGCSERSQTNRHFTSR